MTYNKILKQLASKEKISTKEIEQEIQFALNNAKIEYSAKEFIEEVSFYISNRRYIA